MAAIPGRIGRVQLSTDNGATYINVGGLVDGTLNINVDELEVTTHDSGGSREYLPNFRDETLDLTLRWDETDAGQDALLNANFPTTTTFKVRFLMQQQAGRKQFDADAFLTTGTVAQPLDDTASFDVSMRLSGTIVTVQP